MLWFFTPYSFNRKFFNAIDDYMNLITNPNDWVCILDGDTAFLTPDFGHQVMTYIQKFPDTGLFTSYASRCSYACQRYASADMNNPDILYHKKMAMEIHRKFHGKTVEINRRIAGHLMVIKKRTWLTIREEVRLTSSVKQILGVDTKISNAILKHGMKIRLMQGIYLLHYFRMAEGPENTNHLT